MMKNGVYFPRRVLAQTAKTRGGILEVPAYYGGKFRCSRKNLDFSRTGFARYCRKVRKGLPKLRWGSKKHSKESGRGVFARDSELEREELYLNKKKSYRRPSDLELRLQKLI